MRYYLGVSFEPNGNLMLLHQAAYFKPVLERYETSSAKTAQTLMVKIINDQFMEGSINKNR